MPKTKTASLPVVGPTVDSGRQTHSRIVGERGPSMELPLRSLSNVRAEQQAFARFDLNFVIDRYLPEKLKHPEKFLP